MNKSINIIDLENLIKGHEPIQLVDVRSPGEYASGHVPQAINIPLEQLEARFGDFTEGQVAILCQSGTRAGMACKILNDHHDGLLLVTGGTQAWMDAGLPIVASSASKWSLERQVRLLAGMIVLVGAVLSVTVSPSWIYLAMFVGAGLTFAGITNICGMALLLGKLPWNKASGSCLTPSQVTK
ncbi:MAG: rhodanese-like domain-containing protein [Armatimonadota bacterium]